MTAAGAFLRCLQDSQPVNPLQGVSTLISVYVRLVVHAYIPSVMEYDPRFPKWCQIADVIRSRIASGEYPPRHLISEVRMEEEFETSRPTVRKVTRALREEGLITTHPGMGSFVTDKPHSGDKPNSASPYGE